MILKLSGNLKVCSLKFYCSYVKLFFQTDCRPTIQRLEKTFWAHKCKCSPYNYVSESIVKLLAGLIKISLDLLLKNAQNTANIESIVKS